MGIPIRSRERGAALPLVVVAVMILLAMGAGLLSLGRTTRVYAIRNTSDIAARCAADAGLTIALFEMNKKLQVDPWSEASLPQATDVALPYYDAVYSYQVTGSLAGGYTVESFGQSGNANRDVSATIALRSAFEHAIMAKEQLVLKAGTTVAGYNSLDPTDTDFDVEIGSQSNASGSVVLNNGVNVEGDVFVATGAALDAAIQDHGATTGQKYTAAPELLPTVIAPVLPTKAAIDISGETVTLTPDDSGSYPEIYLRQLSITSKGKGKKVTTTTPSVLEIDGGDVVLHLTGDIQLENSCEIVIKDGSTLTIYIDGNIHCRNSSNIGTENPTKQADTLEIYATGQDIQYFDIKAKSDFTGLIYAPNADVDLYAGGDVYGAIIAENFDFKQGGNFYYDEALRENVSVDDEAVIFSVTRWSENVVSP